MDKKTISAGLIVLSLIAAVLGALDYVANIAPLKLGADSWIIVAATLGIYAVYLREA
jgi:hypothetical protein